MGTMNMPVFVLEMAVGSKANLEGIYAMRAAVQLGSPLCQVQLYPLEPQGFLMRRTLCVTPFASVISKAARIVYAWLFATPH